MVARLGPSPHVFSSNLLLIIGLQNNKNRCACKIISYNMNIYKHITIKLFFFSICFVVVYNILKLFHFIETFIYYEDIHQKYLTLWKHQSSYPVQDFVHEAQCPETP